MFQDFTTIDYVMSFAGMIATVSLLTQFTKSLFDKLLENRTKYVAYGYSVILCIIAAILQGKFSTGKEVIETCLTWFLNSVIVWLTAMKAFEEVRCIRIKKET